MVKQHDCYAILPTVFLSATLRGLTCSILDRYAVSPATVVTVTWSHLRIPDRCRDPVTGPGRCIGRYSGLVTGLKFVAVGPEGR